VRSERSTPGGGRLRDGNSGSAGVRIPADEEGRQASSLSPPGPQQPRQIRAFPPTHRRDLSATGWKPVFRGPRPAFGLLCTLLLAAAPAWGAGFRIEYLAARTPAEIEVLERLQSSERLHRIVRSLGEFLRLPFPVRVKVGGPAEGPYYDVSTRTIGLPYDFLVEATDGVAMDGPERDRLILDLAGFVLCHEVGHVLIHALGMHGRMGEEAAADDLAILLVAEVLGEGPSMAHTLEAWWARDGRLPREPYETSPEEWREEERRRRVLCGLRGSDPEFDPDPDGGIGTEEAVDCRARYLQMRKDWIETLTPLLRRFGSSD
jgi:hypothetical protein